MASIIKRNNNTYRITVSGGFDPVSKRRIRHTTTFKADPKKSTPQNDKAAERFADKFERKVLNGTIKADMLTFKSFADNWMQTYGANHLEATTRATYQANLQNNLYPRCGNLKLSEFRVSTVQALLDNMRATGYTRNDKHYDYSEQTIRTAKTVLSTVLAAAVEDGLLPTNPCAVPQRRHKKVTSPQSVKSFSVEEASRFLDAMDKDIPVICEAKTVIRQGKPVEIKGHINRYFRLHPRYKTLFIVTLFSGCRRGELLALTWENVNFDRGLIRIQQAAAYTSETGQYIKAPKTQAGYRDIFLPAAAMDALKQLKRSQQKEIIKLGTAWEGSRQIEENLCFAGDTGRMMAGSTPRKELNRFLTSYNKAFPEKALPVLTFHQLRHTSASLLISQGLDPVAVAQRLGHADAVTTLRIYAHSFEERDRAAADALESILTPYRQQA